MKHSFREKKKKVGVEFPADPVVRILGFHRKGPGFDPWSGN